jgi:hypothetical protein
MNKNNGILPVDLSSVKTYPLKERKNKVKVSDFASPAFADCTLKDFLAGLPNILAGDNFRQIISAIAIAYKNSKPIIAMLGGHVVKCGLAPVLISMMEKGIITGIAMNGATSIHDFEIALTGETSEDVADNIEKGVFGMWEETGSLINDTIKQGQKRNIGMGQALGEKLLEIKAPYNNVSLLASAFSLNIPATIHVAIGTDIIHQHPSADGSAIGQTSFTDFRIFVSEIANLDGGVLLNFGSAVIMPEVFLKALSIARNLGYNVEKFITANFDMFQHYRPIENVVKRPTSMGGKGYSITGHHEIMIPLLAYAIMDKISETIKKE